MELLIKGDQKSGDLLRVVCGRWVVSDEGVEVLGIVEGNPCSHASDECFLVVELEVHIDWEVELNQREHLELKANMRGQG